jgi:hypothetical protein
VINDESEVKLGWLEMPPGKKIMTKEVNEETFVASVYEGFQHYGIAGKHVDFLTCSMPDGSNDIEKYFLALLKEFENWGRKKHEISYAATYVNGQHVHALVYGRPFMKVFWIHLLWEHATHNKGHSIRIKTVRGDKQKRSDMYRIVDYMTVGQRRKHDGAIKVREQEQRRLLSGSVHAVYSPSDGFHELSPPGIRYIVSTYWGLPSVDDQAMLNAET